MDIKQLINFITIVEEGNITKAACKLNISQPPLSNQLKYMEEELGVKLVERGSRKIRLTDAGDLLYKRGKDIVSVFESTLNEVEDFKSGMEGILKIGVVSTCNQFLPNELILPYSIKYPKMKFELYEGNTYQVIDMVEKRIVDLGVVRTPFNDDNLDYIRLRTEPMVAITKKNDKQYNSQNIYLNDLDKKRLILYRRYEKIIVEELKNKGIKPNIYCINDDSRTTVAWAEAGLGIGIVPKSIIYRTNARVDIYEIDDEVLKTDICIVLLKNKYPSKSVRNLVDMIKNK